MFELRHLHVFREVARLGSLSAAAESLAYTQPAVSQQMSALERRADMPLFDRTTRGVHLTEAGQALLRHADAILAEQALAEQELEAIAGLRGGRVRMASFPTAAAALLPAIASAFTTRYPDIELSVLDAEPEESVPMLRAGEIEAALVASAPDSPVIVRALGSTAPTRTVAAATLAGVHRSPATAALLGLLAEVSERHLTTRRRLWNCAERSSAPV